MNEGHDYVTCTSLVQDTHRVFLSPTSRAWLHKGYIVEMEGVASRPGSIHTTGQQVETDIGPIAATPVLVSKQAVGPEGHHLEFAFAADGAIYALLPSGGLTGAQFFGELVFSQFALSTCLSR